MFCMKLSVKVLSLNASASIIFRQTLCAFISSKSFILAEPTTSPSSSSTSVCP